MKFAMFRSSRRLAPLALVAALTAMIGCSSGPDVDPQITAALASRDVGSATYAKVSAGQVLSYQDILDMVVKKVPAQVIIGYLQSTEKVYNFTYSQLKNLRAAGATPQLLNYLSETQGFYGYNPPAAMERTKTAQKHRYYNSPSDQVDTPFDYNEPVIDDWYDSSYEESLYSPFSMD